jgi:hypothetical protein
MRFLAGSQRIWPGVDERASPERRFLVMVKGLGIAAMVLAGCASSGRGPTSSAARPTAENAGPVPADLSPNVRRDRRATARGAPKALETRGAKCGKLSMGTDDLDLLAGRLRVRAPRGGKIPAPHADAPPAEEESRVVADGRDLSIAIVARETFQLDPDLYAPESDSAPGTLDVEAPRFLQATFPLEEKPEIVPVALGSLRAYVMRPPHPNAPPGKDTALVLAMLVAQDDGPLQSVAFYVRGERVRAATGDDLVGCTRFAERLAGTLTAGARKLERAPGRREVATVNGSTLAVTVPPDYVVVHVPTGSKLTKLRPLSMYPGSIVVNVTEGAHPPDGTDTTTPGKLLGKPIEWRGKATPKGGFFFAAEPIDGGKFAEVLVKATRQPRALDEMRSVAETLTVSR